MMKVEQVESLFSLLRERFDQNMDHLNQLDSAVGDGDHGFTMSRTMQAAETAARSHFSDLGTAFDAVAEAMAENAGGAIGPLLASLFAEGGVSFKGKTSVGLKEFRTFLTGGLEAVQVVGGAQIGDKTLVDALAPAAAAILNPEHKSLVEGLSAAAESAINGAQATTEMTAAHGRASFVADRSVGHQDAGATSLAILLAGLRDFLAGERPSSSLPKQEKEFQPPPGKIINQPDRMILEDNQGLAALYPNLVHLTPDGILVRANKKETGKVALVIGHGGGHTPSMGGFVGPGLLDADVYGPVFTCASGVSIAKAIAAGNRGGGVVLLISNHSGDVLNARLAARRAQQDGIQVEQVLLGDDIATAPRERYQERRGLGGLLFALKIGGGAAEDNKSLPQVADLMRKVNERTATLSVAVSPPTHPATGEPLFHLPEGQIEIGTGVHGEVGVYRGPHMTADQIVDLLLDRLISDLVSFHPKKVLVFVNGAGGTSKMELHIVYRRVHQGLQEREIDIAAGVADSFFTTQEMGGFSLSLCPVDQEMLTYWEKPASAPSFRWPYS